MKIISLVDNFASHNDLKEVHGLSIYVETTKHKILFDLGPDKTFEENAGKLGVDLTKIDTVIISHGHLDHGGALKRFLSINRKAKIYIQEKAFDKHYTKLAFLKINIGLNKKLKKNEQIILLNGDYTIDDELMLFITPDISKCYSKENDSLYDKYGKDTFRHEQNLLISENKKVLIMGCGHAGVVNIMEECAPYKIDFCIGGYHLYNPVNKTFVPEELLEKIITELNKYPNVRYYTCHCTGKNAFDYLKRKMKNMDYLESGMKLDI